MHFGKMELFCTICGKKYEWNPNYGFSRTRTCGMLCHREFAWREVFCITNKPYYPRIVSDEEIAKDIEMGYRSKQ